MGGVGIGVGMHCGHIQHFLSVFWKACKFGAIFCTHIILFQLFPKENHFLFEFFFHSNILHVSLPQQLMVHLISGKSDLWQKITQLSLSLTLWKHNEKIGSHKLQSSNLHVSRVGFMPVVFSCVSHIHLPQ